MTDKKDQVKNILFLGLSTIQRADFTLGVNFDESTFLAMLKHNDEFTRIPDFEGDAIFVRTSSITWWRIADRIKFEEEVSKTQAQTQARPDIIIPKPKLIS